MSCAQINPFPESHFVSGDTFAFTVTEADYPATTYTLSFIIRSGARVLTVAGVTSGSSFTVTLSAAQTATLPAGCYETSFRFTKTSDSTVTTERGAPLRVLPNPASTTLSYAQDQVTRIETQLAAITAAGITSTSFNGQSTSFSSGSELREQLVYWQSRVLAEQRKLAAASGYGFRGYSGAQFGRSGSYSGCDCP